MRAVRRLVPLVATLAACRAAADLPRTPGAGAARVGDEIVVCGERIHVGAPVVLWFEELGYSAYATEPVFAPEGPVGLRYRPGRAVTDPALAQRVRARGWDRSLLREQVDLLVLHYDACGTSRSCFRVLHDERQLSVHFLLDVDGTIYQTLDLMEQAWHARQANARSVGVEIAHIGAYPAAGPNPLDEWYQADGEGVRLTIPERFGDGGVRAAGFRGRPARAELCAGEVHGRTYVQYDFTPEQYASLARLTAALARVLPRITLDAPRDAAGRVRSDVLTDAELRAFRGVLGHQHVSDRKRDPGPAFDWERLLMGARVARRYSP